MPVPKKERKKRIVQSALSTDSQAQDPKIQKWCLERESRTNSNKARLSRVCVTVCELVRFIGAGYIGATWPHLFDSVHTQGVKPNRCGRTSLYAREGVKYSFAAPSPPHLNEITLDVGGALRGEWGVGAGVGQIEEEGAAV